MEDLNNILHKISIAAFAKYVMKFFIGPYLQIYRFIVLSWVIQETYSETCAWEGYWCCVNLSPWQ